MEKQLIQITPEHTLEYVNGAKCGSVTSFL